MPNLDYPSGFEPKYRLGGGQLTTNPYDISASNSAIFRYDLVERAADGTIQVAGATSTTIVGVAARFVAANSGGTVPVYDAPDIVYEAQVQDATVNAQTDLDLNYSLVVTTGDTATGRSRHEIDGSTQAATSTLPIKILRVATEITEEGNVLGEFVRVQCIINQGILKAGALG